MWKITVLSLLTACVAGQTCPIAGPAFPAPRRVIGSVAMDHAVGNFTSSLQRILHATDDPKVTAIDPDATSFTVQVFSTHDEHPLLAHYHTATSARTNTVGVNNVDENTVFRIGSTSKLWTVLLLLIESGDAIFHDPIFKYIPELRDVVRLAKGNPSYVDSIDHVQWEDVTVGEVVSQMAGLERSCKYHN